MMNPFGLSKWIFICLLVLGVGACYFYPSYWWILLILMSLYGVVLFLGSYFIQFNFYTASLNKLPNIVVDFEETATVSIHLQRAVMLTFDDGPHERTNQVLDILKAYNVKAAFFVIGKNIQGREAILERMQEEGHLVGNHSFYHKPSFDWQSVAKMVAELEDTNKAIEKVLGYQPTIFRPPFGVTNPNLARAIKATRMQSIGWNVRSYDTIAKKEDLLLHKILKKTSAGSIILLHDHCEITIKILPKLIEELRQRGYELSTF